MKMLRTIFASAWVLAAMAALVLGVNGSIDRAAMVIFSLVALGLFYAFAMLTVIVNAREPQTQSIRL